MTKQTGAVITGIGAITPLGNNLEDFHAGLLTLKPLKRNSDGMELRSGEKTASGAEWGTCRIPDETFAEIRGSKYFDKCTKLLYCAANQFLKGNSSDGTDFRETAISVGTAFSSFTDFMEFVLCFEREGLRGLNPILFPNTVHNCPASQLAILLKFTGANITISNGLCSGLDALATGSEFIRAGRADRVIVGGVEESSRYLRDGFHHCLSNCKDVTLYPSEAAGVVLVEDEKKAQERNAPIYGKIAGYAQSFFPGKIDNEKSLSEIIEGTIRQAVSGAGLTFEDVGVVSLSANGLPPVDNAELSAVGRLLKNAERPKGLVALKQLIGETGGASGLLQLIVALRGMDMPLGTHYHDCLPQKFVQAHNQKLADNANGQFALINNINWEGNITSVVVERTMSAG